MAPEKSRVGPVLTQEDGLRVRDTYLRLEPRVDIFVREKWAAGDERKLPVVLLHGAGMDGSGWDVPVEDVSLVDVLARNGSRTFAFDFRGHGRSSRAADGREVTVETSIQDTGAVMDWARAVTGAQTVVLVGESYGSMVAPAVAARQPERVAGLALLGLIYERIDASLDETLEAAAREPCGYAFTTEEEWPALFIPSASPAVTAWHQAQFGAAYAYPVGPYLEVARLPHCMTPERIGGCVLAITGDLDPFAAVADTEAFLQAVGTSHTHHLRQQGVGHLPYVERRAREAQQAIRDLIDACTYDIR